jgi:hypothetical protein
MAKKIRAIRVISRGQTGELRTKEYDTVDALVDQYPQIGIDDCSTNLALRGYPTFRGLIGPITDEDGAVRYESPEVFESLTKKWAVDAAHPKKRRRRKASAPTAEAFESQLAEFE